MTIFRLSTVLCTMLLFVAFAAGKTISLDEFSAKIESSINSIDSAMLEIGKLDQGNGDIDQYHAEIEKLRIFWATDIQVNDPPATIAVDSGWVTVELDRLEAEENTDRSALLLTAIRERFDAMKASIDSRKQALGADPTKDSDKRKLDEILKREEFQKPKVEEGLIARLIRQFFEWLNQRSPDAEQQPATNAGSPLLSTILWVIVIGAAIALLVFLLYRFAPSLFEKYTAETRSRLKDRVVLGELIGDDVEASEIFAEAEELARRGELRQAVRKGYIAVLCELADRRLIGLARHKTNRDYLRDVRKRENLRRDLSRLTERFERHWYGDQTVAPEEWGEFRDLYRQTVANRN